MTTPAAGATFGHWRGVKVDGRAATCVCRYGTARVIAVDAIANGTAAPSCGCTPLTSPQIEARREEVEQRQRRREQRDWRPGDRS
jgi:hypothetical protein